MNQNDIRTSDDPDLAGSYFAIQRAARSAEDLAIRTNTGIIVSIDDKTSKLSAAEILELRKKEETL